MCLSMGIRISWRKTAKIRMILRLLLKKIIQMNQLCHGKVASCAKMEAENHLGKKLYHSAACPQSGKLQQVDVLSDFWKGITSSYVCQRILSCNDPKLNRFIQPRQTEGKLCFKLTKLVIVISLSLLQQILIF